MRFINKIQAIFILFSVSIYAQENSSPLDRDLKLGKTLVVGKVIEESSGKRFLSVIKQWTLSPSKILIPDTITPNWKRVKHGNFGGIYFLSALNETNHKGELKPGDIRMLPITSSVVKTVLQGLAVRKNFEGEISPSWQFCESDNECVQVKNKCGNPVGVNKKYKDTYLDFLKTTTKYFDCSKKPDPVSVSKCVENFCS